MTEESVMSINEPVIEITRGFNSSDTIYKKVPLSKVEEYLKNNRDCYERTQPLNRVYIDIDGKADINMSEEDFLNKDKAIESILTNLDLGTPHSIMKSSKYDTLKELNKPQHIFSYRVLLLKKYGSKPSVRNHVETVINPIIKEALKDEITYIVDKKEIERERKQANSSYVSYDEGVYTEPFSKDTCGRKMRMWNTTKTLDYRPFTLCGKSSIIDTLITYIPEGSERLPEPPMEQDDTTSVITTDPIGNESGPLNDEDWNDVVELVGMLSEERATEYTMWRNVIFCLKNIENSPRMFDLCHEFSKKSERYSPRGVNSFYNSIKKRYNSTKNTSEKKKNSLTIYSLYYWAKNDSPEEYKKLRKNKYNITEENNEEYEEENKEDEEDEEDEGEEKYIIEFINENGKESMKITSKCNGCFVKDNHTHSEQGVSCIFINKLKKGYSGIATCFRDGTKQITKEMCNELVKRYWKDKDEEEYNNIKKEFEEKNFKVLDPIGFYTQIGNGWVFRERNQLKVTYENMFLSDGTPFIEKWLKDPKLRTYTHASFEESADPNVFVFPPPPPPSFIHTIYKCKSDENEVQEIIKTFDELLDIVTSKKEAIKTYMLNWFAHLVQKPQELPGVALIINGLKGTGKDTLGDFIGGYVVGNKYYNNYSDQRLYFDKHDELKVGKYFIKIEELDKKMLETGVNGEIFKSAVSALTMNINPKNDKPYNIRNYQHIMITTNKSLPVNIEQRERRWVISVMSPDKIDDHDYWCEIRRILFCKEGGSVISQMLLNRDISKFNPRVLPKNEYLEDLQEEKKDSIVKFIENRKEDSSGNIVYTLEKGEYGALELYKEYKVYCMEYELLPYSSTRFGDQILFLVANGSIRRKIERNRVSAGRRYIIY
jgi:hypothetical protein